uniref:ITPRIP like 2 n=1 Tax=Callorhinchus milii TaxID=7868 RepID=A0A4W3I6Y3_CALMI|eukprot:gi/632952578/ref/XP_007891928.1/ PREDICTED: inositol 1,4,5-trisphosphate receptor-interacting protein-like 2 [Callorhinchus milii]
MSVYPPSVRVCWLLATCCGTALLCLHRALKSQAGQVEGTLDIDLDGQGQGQGQSHSHSQASALPLFSLSAAFLVCYSFIKCRTSITTSSSSSITARLQASPTGKPRAQVPAGDCPCPDLGPDGRRSALETYYDQQMKVSPHVLGHSKAHVTQIVGQLVRVGKREAQEDSTLTFRGDFVQIGSAYEQHKIHSPHNGFDLLVPIRVPQVWCPQPAFELESNVGDTQELPQHLCGAAVCQLKPFLLPSSPPPSSSSPPSPSSPPGGFKKPEGWGKRCKSFSHTFCAPRPDKALCLALSSSLVLKWFHAKMQRCLSVIRYRCQERCSMTLSVEDDSLTLKLLPKSDYVCCHIAMSVRLIPAVHVGDSVFLVAQPWTRTRSPEPPGSTPAHAKPEALWRVYLPKHEQKLLNWLKEQTPANSCHLKCLQVLKALRDVGCKDLGKKVSAKWSTVLSSHNLKTAMFYLVLKGPLEAWDERFLMERLEDMVRFWRERLRQQRLMHFFLGNKKVPDFLTVPRQIKEALPVNLLAGFDAALLDLVSVQLLETWNCSHLKMKLTHHKHLPRNH